MGQCRVGPLNMLGKVAADWIFKFIFNVRGIFLHFCLGLMFGAEGLIGPVVVYVYFLIWEGWWEGGQGEDRR